LIVLDTSFVFALLDKKESRHLEATRWYEGLRDPIVTTPLVLVELDYLLRARATAAAVETFYGEVRAGNLGVEWWPGLDRKAAEVAERYAEIGLGLVDASLVALAARLETNRIASFDERHFRAVEPLDGAGAFTLLPADA
jgi:predicted nucleic acid-binding protein